MRVDGAFCAKTNKKMTRKDKLMTFLLAECYSG